MRLLSLCKVACGEVLECFLCRFRVQPCIHPVCNDGSLFLLMHAGAMGQDTSHRFLSVWFVDGFNRTAQPSFKWAHVPEASFRACQQVSTHSWFDVLTLKRPRQHVLVRDWMGGQLRPHFAYSHPLHHGIVCDRNIVMTMFHHVLSEAFPAVPTGVRKGSTDAGTRG